MGSYERRAIGSCITVSNAYLRDGVTRDNLVMISDLSLYGARSDCAVASLTLEDSQQGLYSIYLHSREDGVYFNAGYLGTRNQAIDDRNGTLNAGYLSATPSIMSLWKIEEQDGGVTLQQFSTR